MWTNGTNLFGWDIWVEWDESLWMGLLGGMGRMADGTSGGNGTDGGWDISDVNGTNRRKGGFAPSAASYRKPVPSLQFVPCKDLSTSSHSSIFVRKMGAMRGTHRSYVTNRAASRPI